MQPENINIHGRHQSESLVPQTYYLIHPDSKQPTEMTFHIASNEGSVLLSCNTSLNLSLIHSRPRLDYLPPRASLITSKRGPSKKNKITSSGSKTWSYNETRRPTLPTPTVTNWKYPQLITNQKQILQEFTDVFEGIGKFLGPPYHIQVDPTVTPKETLCRPIPIHLKDAFQKKINQMLQAGVLLPVHEATPWINSFILVEKRDTHRQVKLRICLDPTNLNKAVTREPYHFWTLNDIVYLIADACIFTVCNCKKGYWHEMLDESLLIPNNLQYQGRKIQIHCHAIWHQGHQRCISIKTRRVLWPH